MVMMQIGRAYGARIQSVEVMNNRLHGFIFMTSARRWWWLVTSFARLLRNRDIGPANFFCIVQAWGNGWRSRRVFAIVEVKFLNPVLEGKELGCFDELGESQ